MRLNNSQILYLVPILHPVSILRFCEAEFPLHYTPEKCNIETDAKMLHFLLFQFLFSPIISLFRSLLSSVVHFFDCPHFMPHILFIFPYPILSHLNYISYFLLCVFFAIFSLLCFTSRPIL